MAQATAITLHRFEVRQHRRVHNRVPFTATVRYFDWDHARTASARELSAGGLFLHTDSPLAEGRLITLRIDLAGVDESFTVLARVVRTVRGNALRDSGMGLEFIDISSEHRTLVQAYVAARTDPV